VLVRERNPPVWYPYVANMLLGALNRADLRVQQAGLET
jgi:hypothetical protein